MINGQRFFDQLVRNNLMAFGNIQIVATVQGDYRTTSCLLDYFKKYYEKIGIDLGKQQALDFDPKAVQ